MNESNNNRGLFNTVSNAVQKWFTVKYIAAPQSQEFTPKELERHLMHAQAISFSDLSLDISLSSFSLINLPNGKNTEDNNKLMRINNSNLTPEQLKQSNGDLISISLETKTQEEVSWSELGTFERSFERIQDDSIVLLTDRSGHSNSGFEIIDETRSPRLMHHDSFMFPVESESFTTMTLSRDQSLATFEDEITDLKGTTYNSLLAELDHIWYSRRNCGKRM